MGKPENNDSNKLDSLFQEVDSGIEEVQKKFEKLGGIRESINKEIFSSLKSHLHKNSSQKGIDLLLGKNIEVSNNGNDNILEVIANELVKTTFSQKPGKFEENIIIRNDDNSTIKKSIKSILKQLNNFPYLKISCSDPKVSMDFFVMSVKMKPMSKMKNPCDFIL